MKLSRIQEDRIVYQALNIMSSRIETRSDYSYVSDPSSVVEYLRLALGHLDHEAFYVVFLNARHGVIATEKMFTGNTTGASVYVGRVARAAVLHNAVALVVAHNHPSGIAEPSSADRELTERLRSGLAILEIRLLDHLVFAPGAGHVSFAERGWL